MVWNGRYWSDDDGDYVYEDDEDDDNNDNVDDNNDNEEKTYCFLHDFFSLTKSIFNVYFVLGAVHI